MINSTKEKLVGATGSISGIASVLGSWQVCHNICLGLIAILSVVGITLIGMPLEFLTKISVPMWSFAFALLLVILWFYFKKKCISKNLVLINSGLIAAGIPFKAVQRFQLFFWIIGGILVISGIYLYINEKIKKPRFCHDKN